MAIDNSDYLGVAAYFLGAICVVDESMNEIESKANYYLALKFPYAHA
jgi:hypothetical protein